MSESNSSTDTSYPNPTSPQFTSEGDIQSFTLPSTEANLIISPSIPIIDNSACQTISPLIMGNYNPVPDSQLGIVPVTTSLENNNINGKYNNDNNINNNNKNNNILTDVTIPDNKNENESSESEGSFHSFDGDNADNNQSSSNNTSENLPSISNLSQAQHYESGNTDIDNKNSTYSLLIPTGIEINPSVNTSGTLIVLDTPNDTDICNNTNDIIVDVAKQATEPISDYDDLSIQNKSDQSTTDNQSPSKSDPNFQTQSTLPELVDETPIPTSTSSHDEISQIENRLEKDVLDSADGFINLDYLLTENSGSKTQIKESNLADNVLFAEFDPLIAEQIQSQKPTISSTEEQVITSQSVQEDATIDETQEEIQSPLNTKSNNYSELSYAQHETAPGLSETSNITGNLSQASTDYNEIESITDSTIVVASSNYTDSNNSSADIPKIHLTSQQQQFYPSNSDNNSINFNDNNYNDYHRYYNDNNQQQQYNHTDMPNSDYNLQQHTLPALSFSQFSDQASINLDLDSIISTYSSNNPFYTDLIDQNMQGSNPQIEIQPPPLLLNSTNQQSIHEINLTNDASSFPESTPFYKDDMDYDDEDSNKFTEGMPLTTNQTTPNYSNPSRSEFGNSEYCDDNKLSNSTNLKDNIHSIIIKGCQPGVSTKSIEDYCRSLLGDSIHSIRSSIDKKLRGPYRLLYINVLGLDNVEQLAQRLQDEGVIKYPHEILRVHYDTYASVIASINRRRARANHHSTGTNSQAIPHQTIYPSRSISSEYYQGDHYIEPNNYQQQFEPNNYQQQFEPNNYQQQYNDNGLQMPASDCYGPETRNNSDKTTALPRGEFVLCLEKVPPPIDEDVLLDYFADYVDYTVRWDSWTTQDEFLLVHVVFSDLDAARHAVDNLSARPLNGANILISIIPSQTTATEATNMHNTENIVDSNNANKIATSGEDWVKMVIGPLPTDFDTNSLWDSVLVNFQSQIIYYKDTLIGNLPFIVITFNDPYVSFDVQRKLSEFNSELNVKIDEYPPPPTTATASDIPTTVNDTYSVNVNCNTVSVNNIYMPTKGKELFPIFKNYGIITSGIFVVPDRSNSKLGQCLVKFSNPTEAIYARNELNGFNYRGYNFVVSLLSEIGCEEDDSSLLETHGHTQSPPEQYIADNDEMKMYTKKLSSDLFTFIKMTYLQTIEVFNKNQCHFTYESTSGVCVVKAATEDNLKRFIDMILSKVSELSLQLDADDFARLMNPEEDSGSPMKQILLLKEAKQIEIIYHDQMNEVHIFGEIKSVETAKRVFQKFLYLQIPLTSPKVIFFSKFQSLLCEAPSLFDINDSGILFGGDDPESCKDLRAKMKEVVQNCVCISIDNFPIRLFKSATNYIQLNAFQVCLLAKFSDNNKFTEEIPKASQKATTHLCGMQTTVDHVIKLLYKPSEKLVLLCRTTLRSLTESNQQSNLLPHVTSLESQYSVCLTKIDSNKQSGLLVRGYSKENIDAVCEELLKLFSDASIQFNKLNNSGNEKGIRMQEIYIVQGNKNNHEGTKQFIKKIELDFQVKFESIIKGNQGCIVLSGDQDSLSKIEVNPNGLFEYLNQHIPFFELKNKVVETQYLNSFKQLIFNYLQYLTRQFNKHILYDILDKILDTREGYSQIILDIVLLAEDKNFIDDKLREIKCTTELIQLKSSDMNLIHNAKSNFEGIAKTDFCMFEINVEKSGLLTHSLGITTHSLNDLISSAIGDLNDKRIYYIQNPSWAFYFKAKNMLKQCQDSFNCKFDMYEKKDINIEKTKTCIDIEGRRKEINDAYDKLQNWNAQFTCKNVNFRIKSFEFDYFSREVSQVKTNLEQKHSSVIIDIQDVQIKLPQCQQRPINPVVIKVLSLNDEEAEKLATFLSGCLSYVQAEPIILTRDQYQKLKFAMDNGIICQKGEYYHLHFERTSDNTQRMILFAMEYFASEAMKKGTALLKPYLELHREEYRPSNSYIASHLIHNKECIESFNQMALRNDVSIQAKNNHSEPYILVGAKEKVLKQLNEMESYEHSLKQTFIKENIDIQFPISCLLNDSEFSTISKTIEHPDVNVQLICPQLSRQIELQGCTIIATYEIILAIQKVIIEIRKGDITKLQVDAIVNAANDQLKHGGGVALAISEAGGPHIQLESDVYINKFGPIPVGFCVQLSPGNLKCNRIIHAVGPQWDSNKAQEVTDQLSRCVTNICSLASHVGMSVVAIPTISAGIFAFPQDICCRTIIHSLATFFNTNSHSSLSRVILVDINDDILAGLKSECDKQLLSQNLNSQVQPKSISAPAAKVRKITSSLINSVFNKIPHLPVQDDTIVKFEWQENDFTWKPYDPNSTIALQNAYKANPTGIAHTTRSEFTYTVNFSSCIQTNDQTGVQRRIRIVNSTVDSQPSVLTGTQMQQLSGAPALNQNMVVEPPIDLSNPQWSRIDKEQICLYGHKDRLQHAKSVLNGLVESRMRTKEHELTDISKQCLHKMLSSLKERYSFLKICVKINDAPDTYTIQLEGYYKFVKDASNDMQLNYRDILLQERKVNSDPPKHWKPQNKNLHIEQINQATPEYQEVANNFHKSCQRVILKVERIQNIWLWTRYMQDKERMGRKCSAGAHEIRVFHGTSDNPPEKIYNGEKGFDARFCYGMWGTASYFAVNAQYSDSGYAHQLKDGSRQIFMVCLCAGDFIEMVPDPNLRKPPLKSQSSVQNLVGELNFTDVYYDTVTGLTNGSRVYMLYENGRAYPEYLITYR